MTEAACVMARSAPVTVTDPVPLFVPPGAGPVQLTVALLVMVDPPGASGSACTTRVKVREAFPATLFPPLSVHVTVPVEPTAGFVPQVQFAGGVIDSNTVFTGVVCVSCAPVAAVAVVFVTVSVNVMFAPVATGFGDPLSETVSVVCAEAAAA